MTTLQVCFWGQEIHFCGYFSLLTKNTRDGGQKYHFCGQNVQNIDIVYLKMMSHTLFDVRRQVIHPRIPPPLNEEVHIHVYDQRLA